MNATRNASKGTDARDGRKERQPFYTTVRVVPTGDNHWKATEPEGEKEHWGRGETPTEAVMNYAELIENMGEME